MEGSETPHTEWKKAYNRDKKECSMCSIYYEVHDENDYLLQDQMSDPIAFLTAQSSVDSFYFDHAMYQEDREHFIQAILD